METADRIKKADLNFAYLGKKALPIKDRRTYDDVFSSEGLTPTDVTRQAFKDVPFYYQKYVPGAGVQSPSLEDIVGPERAQLIMDNIGQHKQWIGGNDVKIDFSPDLFRNLSSPEKRTVTVNALDPAVIHHELGHIATTPSNAVYRFLKSNADVIGPATAGAGLAGELMLPRFRSAFRMLRRLAPVVPLAGYGEKLRSEYAASQNAKDFMATHYPQEDMDRAKDILDAGIQSHARQYKKPLIMSGLTMLGSSLADRLLARR